MKAKLEFELPDDQQDFNVAINGLNFWRVLNSMDQYLNSNTKYAPDSMSKEKYDTYDEIRDKLFELMSENNVSLDIVK
jgi:hypothetical protein